MKALIIHRDRMPALNTLTDVQLGQLMRCCMSYVYDERDEAPADPALAFAWHTIRENIRETGIRYDEECARRREHARTAAAARYADKRPAFRPSLPEHPRARAGMQSST